MQYFGISNIFNKEMRLINQMGTLNFFSNFLTQLKLINRYYILMIYRLTYQKNKDRQQILLFKYLLKQWISLIDFPDVFGMGKGRQYDKEENLLTFLSVQCMFQVYYQLILYGLSMNQEICSSNQSNFLLFSPIFFSKSLICFSFKLQRTVALFENFGNIILWMVSNISIKVSQLLIKSSQKEQIDQLIYIDASIPYFYQQLIKTIQLIKMEYPNSIYWPPYLHYPMPNFFDPYQIPHFPPPMTLYPNFQNSYTPTDFLPNQYGLGYYEPDQNIPSPLDQSNNDRQPVNVAVKIESQIKKARSSKKKPKSTRDNRILRECLEPTKHDRNIQSNALKIFLKYIRNDSSLRYSPVRKAIQKKKLLYSPEEFVEDLNNTISPSLNYIRPLQIKEICEKHENLNFSLVFRICIKDFFTKEIHMMSTKPVRTNRFVRRQQIKAGRRLIENLFDC